MTGSLTASTSFAAVMITVTTAMPCTLMWAYCSRYTRMNVVTVVSTMFCPKPAATIDDALRARRDRASVRRVGGAGHRAASSRIVLISNGPNSRFARSSASPVSGRSMQVGLDRPRVRRSWSRSAVVAGRPRLS